MTNISKRHYPPTQAAAHISDNLRADTQSFLDALIAAEGSENEATVVEASRHVVAISKLEHDLLRALHMASRFLNQQGGTPIPSWDSERFRRATATLLNDADGVRS